MASSPALREVQRDIETQANALSKLQKDIAKNHQVRKQYTIQLGENELVLKVFPLTLLFFLRSFGYVSRIDVDAHNLQELELLNENANVYKLIGPVLVKQDLAEANANVRKRIEYISAELKRLEGTLQDLEDKQNSKRDSILKSQQKIQALQAGKAKS
uniref:Prefoldin subunit 6 isoform X1 n=1 Tax=Elaeis guineensis var. tenera TaxID=51953 RepID=A0A6I9QWK1_ELAGV|nr:prefoldin subunit 6 isoform X1 [Elaeis guineensis]